MPKAAGAFSAWGMLETDIRHDMAAISFPLTSIDQIAAEQRLLELEEALRRKVAAEGYEPLRSPSPVL